MSLRSTKSSQRFNRTAFAAALFAVALAAMPARGGTINFSGRSWDTYDHVFAGQYEPDQSNQYVTPDANTGVMTGRFGSDAGDDTFMTTAIAVQVGDKVAYNYHLTEESRNFRGSGASTYVGDSRSGFQDSSGNWVTARVATYTGRWTQYWEGGDPESSVDKARGLDDHFTVEWTFTSSTTATATLTLEGESAPYATWTDTFSDVGNIAKFRVGLWDSEQDVTLSNFTHTPIPEPAGVALLGLTGLAVVRRRTHSRPV